MSIKRARQIPLKLLVEHLGGCLSHQSVSNAETWYSSPFRPKERTASFKIIEKKNTWFDFGHAGGFKSSGNGGDIIDLWCDFHMQDRRFGFRQALNDIANLALQPYTYNMFEDEYKTPQVKQPSRLKIIRTQKKYSIPH